jgi:hypothetical protein
MLAPTRPHTIAMKDEIRKIQLLVSLIHRKRPELWWGMNALTRAHPESAKNEEELSDEGSMSDWFVQDSWLRDTNLRKRGHGLDPE